MISLALFQFCTIVFYHFLTYTCHCNVVTTLKTGKKRLMKLCTIYRKDIDDYRNSNDLKLTLLNIPEPIHNYNEYRGGLVSNDFEYNH